METAPAEKLACSMPTNMSRDAYQELKEGIALLAQLVAPHESFRFVGADGILPIEDELPAIHAEFMACHEGKWLEMAMETSYEEGKIRVVVSCSSGNDEIHANNFNLVRSFFPNEEFHEVQLYGQFDYLGDGRVVMILSFQEL